MKPILYIFPLELRNVDFLPVLSTIDRIVDGKYPNYNISLERLINDKRLLSEHSIIIIFPMPMDSTQLVNINLHNKHTVDNWFRLFNLCLDICKQRKDTRILTGCDWDENNVQNYDNKNLIKVIVDLLENKSVRFCQVTWLYNNPFVPSWLEEECSDNNDCIHSLYHSSYINRMVNVRKEIFKDSLVLNSKKSHYFLSLNRFARPHRMMLCYWMYKNCKKPSYISCRLANEENYSDFWHTDAAYTTLNSLFYYDQLDELQTYLDFANTLPWQLDYKTDKDKTLPSVQQDILPSKYIYDSACYIVTETHFTIPTSNNNKGFLSEKTLKGFVWGLPSIYVAPAYTIQALKLLGYRSFNGLINEDYDYEPDSIKRMQMIFSEIDRIQKIENIGKWYYKGIEIYKHNYNMIDYYINRDVSKLVEDYHISCCRKLENNISAI